MTHLERRGALTLDSPRPAEVMNPDALGRDYGNARPTGGLRGSPVVAAMSDLSSKIRFCVQRAAECRRNAEQATDPSRRQSWLKTEAEWFFLARSYDNQRRAALEETHNNIDLPQSTPKRPGP